MQKTIAKAFTIKGIGLHSGKEFQAVISPAPCNTGIQFKRDDVRHCDYTRITPYNVSSTQLATTIDCGGLPISTIEHFSAAFYGQGIDNAFISVSGTEVPILDGSAKEVIEKTKINKDSYECHLKMALKKDYNEFKYAKENMEHYKTILNDAYGMLKIYENKYKKNEATLLNVIQVENEYKSNQEHEGTNQPHTDSVTRKLTKKEEDIRNFCSIPRTAQEIMDRLKITNQSKNRQKYITPLIKIGVLERTIPEKPNDPNQKYRRKK